MIIRGKPVVPPTCPRSESAGADIQTASLEVYIGDANSDGQEVTEVFFSFGSWQDETGVGTAALVVPVDSALSERVDRLYDRLIANREETEMAVRAAVCRRVINCQGVFEGECDALGASAVQSVVEELTAE